MGILQRFPVGQVVDMLRQALRNGTEVKQQWPRYALIALVGEPVARQRPFEPFTEQLATYGCRWRTGALAVIDDREVPAAVLAECGCDWCRFDARRFHARQTFVHSRNIGPEAIERVPYRLHQVPVLLIETPQHIGQ
ncbi:hypothetical protein D3C77_94480 [compost metagenome]